MAEWEDGKSAPARPCKRQREQASRGELCFLPPNQAQRACESKLCETDEKQNGTRKGQLLAMAALGHVAYLFYSNFLHA